MSLNTTEFLSGFVADLEFQHLPAKVVHETKRIMLDVIGCALGSPELDKSRIAIAFARDLGGRPEATILGTSDRTSAAIAAFANAELMHATDHCPVLPPAHISPFVTSAALALAEAKGASGKDLVLGVALAHEVSSRVGLSLDPMRVKGGIAAQSWGLGFNALGAAAGAAKILGLSGSAMTDALGLAGYLAPVPSHNKFLNSPQGGGMAKYGPAGWTAQAGVTAAVLASMGYEGDRTVLDGEYGFWSMTSSRNFAPDKITGGLGDEWNIMRVMYKRWPCAGNLQAPIAAFTRLVEDLDLKPEEIEQIRIWNEGQGLLPRFQYGELHHNVDAQVNLPYNIALAGYGRKVSSAWQNPGNLNDPGVRELMAKVVVEAYEKAEETRYQELVVEGRPYIERRPCRVEVSARGKLFVEEVEYAYWLSIDNPDFRATDGDLIEKFRANASATLSEAKIERAVKKIMTLEQFTDVVTLFEDMIPDRPAG